MQPEPSAETQPSTESHQAPSPTREKAGEEGSPMEDESRFVLIQVQAQGLAMRVSLN